ncbi:MAG: DNA polymerase III subunit delta [Phycisphaerae bacterium]
MVRPADNTPKTVYAVVGKDMLLRSEALAAILRACAPGGATGAGADVTRVDCASGDVELADVLDDVRTLSLLGERRVVVVDNADAFISAHRKALEKYCSAPVATGTLIFVCNSFPKNQNLYKIIARIGGAVECPPPNPSAIVPWIVRRAKHKYEKRLAADAAQRLRACVGDTLSLLDAELAKLASFVGGRDTIEPADIEALVGQHREEKVFAIVDAVLEGDAPAAMKQWDQVLATDLAAPGRAVGGLAYGVRQWVEARRAFESGGNLYGLTRKLYRDEAAIRRRFDRVSLEEMEDLQKGLLDVEIAVKTGASTVERAIEKFIVTHAHGRGKLRRN